MNDKDVYNYCLKVKTKSLPIGESDYTPHKNRDIQ